MNVNKNGSVKNRNKEIPFRLEINCRILIGSERSLKNNRNIQ